MTCCHVVSVVLQVAILFAAAISHFVPRWVESDVTDDHVGLWEMCVNATCTWTYNSDVIPDWLGPTRIAHACVVGGALLAVILGVGLMAGNSAAGGVNMVINLLACFVCTYVLINFAVKYHKGGYIGGVKGHLAWAFYASVGVAVGFVLSLISLVCGGDSGGGGGYQQIKGFMYIKLPNA